MKIQNILKKHGIKVRGLRYELWKSDELQDAFKTITEYCQRTNGLETTVKFLQAELDKQKARANGLAIELEEARKTNQNHSQKASDYQDREESLGRKVNILKSRVEQLEDFCVEHGFWEIYTTNL